ncbi:unnamed protein product [Pleuronectes platessa]|uniref:Uncharacterized protein n=1 Tax=Pleuronectes platessa TaxID=8262 RepID=A0A9N7UW25_PLEPL|nr:unnamed protein product [Pleuronectes platessa]
MLRRAGSEPNLQKNSEYIKIPGDDAIRPRLQPPVRAGFSEIGRPWGDVAHRHITWDKRANRDAASRSRSIFPLSDRIMEMVMVSGNGRGWEAGAGYPGGSSGPLVETRSTCGFSIAAVTQVAEEQLHTLSLGRLSSVAHLNLRPETLDCTEEDDEVYRQLD